MSGYALRANPTYKLQPSDPNNAGFSGSGGQTKGHGDEAGVVIAGVGRVPWIAGFSDPRPQPLKRLGITQRQTLLVFG